MDIINKGLGESANPQKPYMPVWGPVISKSQVNDLVEYIHAGLPNVKDATPVAVPEERGRAPGGRRRALRPRGLHQLPRADNRPDKLNAISHELKHALVERLRAADADPGTSVVVLRAEGRSFSAATTSPPTRPAPRGAATRWPGTSRSPTTSGSR